MSGIFYDARKIKIYEAVKELCGIAGESEAWTNGLWGELLTDRELMEEMVYYLEHHTFLDQLKVGGYGLCDLYVWQMNRYNLIKDTGKNPRTCNKEKMAMQAFRTMAELLADPEKNLKKLEYGQGTDRL